MGVLSSFFLQGCRPLGSPLLGLAGPMDERARFRCKGAGGRWTSRGTASDVASSMELCGEVPRWLGWGSACKKNDKIVRIQVIGACE